VDVRLRPDRPAELHDRGTTVVAYNAFGDMTSKPEDTGTESTAWT
jgi:hypothetical protein